GKPAPPPRKGDCGPWYVEKQGNEEVVVNACGGVLTGTFSAGGTASAAANALNEKDDEKFNQAIYSMSYHSICEDITGEDCPFVLPGFGDNDWVGIGEYGSDGTDGYIVYEDIPGGSPTRNLKIKVGAFEPRFPMYREWSSMLTRKRGQ
ncbi:MAG: hypothetical protein HY774_28870, partial [Acidobacteria bacterium]|nr:hypothetical protein [Acidobacteriota bacterium]